MQRSPAVKLAVFGAVLAVAFGGGALAGATFGSDPDTPPVHEAPDDTGHADHTSQVTGP